jgi:hypothetical protein|tara:strand:- start:427 stop:612 length:186 start_codon:yes stop_codon:yes gene_type:complete
MWSQRDLETSITSLCRDLNDHVEMVEKTTNSDMHDIKKQVSHARYELMTVAKKIETKIDKG